MNIYELRWCVQARLTLFLAVRYSRGIAASQRGERIPRAEPDRLGRIENWSRLSFRELFKCYANAPPIRPLYQVSLFWSFQYKYKR